jgi:RIO kinase 1
MEEEDSDSRLKQRIFKSQRDSRYLRKDSDDRKVMEEVLDNATRLALYDLLNRGDIRSIEGTVNSGKESRVYYGFGVD